MDVLVAGVYRAANEAPLARLLAALPADWRLALWALDRTLPAYAGHTVGVGTGGKFELANRLYDAAGAGADVVVLVDDDVWLTRGTLPDLVSVAGAAGFDLAQPAHGRGSRSTYTFNRRRPALRARETTFVEIGPILVLRRHALGRVIPFPADVGMGWGLELLWRRQRADGLRLGIVDDVAVHHPDPPNATYMAGAGPEFERVARLLAEDGLADLAAAQETVGRWWRWQRRAPWAEAA